MIGTAAASHSSTSPPGSAVVGLATSSSEAVVSVSSAATPGLEPVCAAMITSEDAANPKMALSATEPSQMRCPVSGARAVTTPSLVGWSTAVSVTTGEPTAPWFVANRHRSAPVAGSKA